MKIFPIVHFTVHGQSMFPTLKPGQDVLCFNWAYIFSKPKKGDIVVIEHQGKEIIKRVHLYHDRGIFVQGDNKKGSTDSRSFGPVDKSKIIGKVIFIG